MSERLSVEEFLDLARMGAIGPEDGATHYVVVENGAEREVPFGHPREIPAEAIAVMYYSK